MDKQALIDYVIRQKKRGVTNADLKSALRRSGWGGEDIDSALVIASGKTVELTQFRPKRDIYITILSIADFILGAFLILTGLIMVFFQKGLIAWVRWFDIGFADALSGSLLIIGAMVLMLMGVIPMLVGHSLFSLRRWAWISTLAFCVIGIAMFFWSYYIAAISVVLMILLVKRSTREAFFGYV